MSRIKLDYDKPNISVEKMLVKLSLEADILSNVIATFKDILPKVQEKLYNVSLSFYSKESKFDIKKLNMLRKSIEDKSKIANINSFDLENILIPVPEGFKGKFIDYGKYVRDSYLPHIAIVKQNLTHMNFIMSSFITNKEDKFSNTDNTKFINKVKQSNEETLKKMNTFFTGDSSQRAKLFSVIDRLNDFNELIPIVNKVIDIHDSDNLKEVNHAVKQTIDLVEIITKNAENNIQSVSGASAKTISEGTYELAKSIEILSIYIFRVEAYITCVIKTVEMINEKIK